MRTNILVFAAILCVCHVLGQSTDCTRATSAALEFRDYFKMSSGGHAKSLFKSAIKMVGINLYSDQEIEELMCAIIGAEEKTIAHIAMHNNVVRDAKQLAFAYSTLVMHLKENLDSSRLMRLEQETKFYDATGYPDFPLKISDVQLSKMIFEMDNSSLSDLFWPFTDYSSDEVGFDREALFTSLTGADSLEDFMRTDLLDGHDYGYSDYYDDFFEARVLSLAEYARGRASEAHAKYQQAKEEFIQIEKFLDVLEKTGVLGVTRGGPELYSCDFIADTAVEALGYAVKFFGTKVVQEAMSFDMGLNFTVDDIPAVRTWICSLVSSKSQAELKKYYSVMYEELAFNSQYELNTLFFVGMEMPGIRMAKIVERLDFSNLPKDQAKQFAALLKQWYRDDNLDVDTLAQTLQEMDSLEDAAERFDVFHSLKWAMRRFGGKTDTAVLFASSVYQLALSAEELGLFMLPPN